MADSLQDYKSLLKKLFAVNLHGGMKLGLSNIEKLNNFLGNPNQNFVSIHVAGTNGKGSVSTKIAEALKCEGYRVGLFTSPHISTFRERIKVNDTLIDENTTAKLLQKIFSLAEKEKINATFFEIVTALAFLYFSEQRVDYAILETGLGGRLDATNIVIPQLSIITSISLEHTEFLGHTLEEITLEKAGIIKPGIPVVIGPCVQTKIVEEIANSQKSSFEQVTGHFIYFDDENRAIARRALEMLHISENSISKGLKALPPCRMEMIGDNPHVLLDVGHNPDGLEHLLQAIKQKFHQISIRVVFGLSKSKDIDGCLNVLMRMGDNFHLVEATNGRGLDVQALHKKMIEHYFNPDHIFIDGDISHTIQKALHEAKKHRQLLVICGTFFIMSDARAALGINEPCDDYDINER
jgi:dihydrofolate synthase / folylpolyglutamate synthase